MVFSIRGRTEEFTEFMIVAYSEYHIVANFVLWVIFRKFRLQRIILLEMANIWSLQIIVLIWQTVSFDYFDVDTCDVFLQLCFLYSNRVKSFVS